MSLIAYKFYILSSFIKLILPVVKFQHCAYRESEEGKFA